MSDQPTRNKSGRLRDNQRQKVYRAERFAFKEDETILAQWDDCTYEGRTVQECEDWIMAVIRRKTFQRWFPRAHSALVHHDGFLMPFDGSPWIPKQYGLRIADGRGCRRATASYDGQTITLPRWARVEYVMLHELSHLVVHHEFKRREVASHGWQFCMVYLKLVKNVLGPETHDRLKQSFKTLRVKYTKPRAKRQYTDEEREVMRARMAAVRAAHRD